MVLLYVSAALHRLPVGHVTIYIHRNRCVSSCYPPSLLLSYTCSYSDLNVRNKKRTDIKKNRKRSLYIFHSLSLIVILSYTCSRLVLNVRNKKRTEMQEEQKDMLCISFSLYHCLYLLHMFIFRSERKKQKENRHARRTENVLCIYCFLCLSLSFSLTHVHV